ncbi:suppressor of cytokine signaling 6-like isoform X2 [Uranotaenia lowii]|uniref:suppressor of cytokine signaling 6-like isoform X2 n=1 Tax=Uranotaenia lowii TaxID=190385 RepID=UPI00247B1538|nr:suppressor of cytokine signaling 6-like isoform X2 [Uranotaenia lowii]
MNPKIISMPETHWTIEVETSNRGVFPMDYNLPESSDDFARIVIERHTQHPIRFSSPNSNATSEANSNASDEIPLPNMRSANTITEAADNMNLDKIMENMRNDLLKYGWYWGKLTRSAAQKRLARKCNGTFLVRDSETEKYQFAVSFRSSGITLHCRIDYKDNYWSFSGLTTPTQYKTLIELIEESMKKSEFDVIGFGKQTSPLTPPFPVRLTKPVNRFYEVSSLQHLCRFIIRQQVEIENIGKLPLPSKLKDYVEENFYDQ